MEQVAATEQQQQQQPAVQKKKKSKNKKGNKSTATADLGSTMETEGAKSTELNANGLSEQLAHELHINGSNSSVNSNSKSNNNKTNNTNSTAANSDAKVRKVANKLANGTAKKQSAATAPHQVNGHDKSLATALPTPAETKTNGSTAAQETQQQQQQQQQQHPQQQQQQTGKKSKSKSSKQKHKESDKVKNCHEHDSNNQQEQTEPSAAAAAATSLAASEQESHVETLENGFCTASKEDDDDDDGDKLQKTNSFKQDSKENLKVTAKQVEVEKERVAAPEAKQQDTMQQQDKQDEQGSNAAATAAAAAVVTTPASTANTKVDNASSNDDAGRAAEGAVASPTLDLSNVHIEYKEYESELQMHDIMRLIQAELSEPYSIYTYRYFIYNWPKLCFLAAHGNEYVGAIVCKLDRHMNVKRGYIAMLAVRKEYRKLKIGTTLVQKAIEAMLADNADEVVLETEMRNLPALRLYENLGFVRDKRLFRYYLNGVDALRLKLWFR